MTIQASNRINDIAALIREVDGDNKLSPKDLGWAIAAPVTNGVEDLEPIEVARFVELTNPDKRLGAGALAELIVAEFNLGDA